MSWTILVVGIALVIIGVGVFVLGKAEPAPGTNKIKIIGVELETPVPSLVLVAIGCALIITATNKMPEPVVCESFAGLWQREDDQTIQVGQAGCTITAFLPSDPAKNMHNVQLMANVSDAVGSARRMYNDCVTILSLHWTKMDEDHFKSDGQGDGCELHNYREHYVYHRLN
jgi:hypothetical protein